MNEKNRVKTSPHAGNMVETPGRASAILANGELASEAVSSSTATFAFAPCCRRRLDGLVLKPQVRQAFWNGVDVDLTAGEFKIVDLLATPVGRRVTHREIYDVLSECGVVAGCGVNGYRANVRSAIKRIRRKFEECDPTFDRIQNDTAYGYVWARD